ncbi:branched-chain amino acid ABC transporter substrate-binding protein [Herbaspirillum sp. LeCh32-8]|uniref:branched-chain amino acid ABC transporter substrate-binding protein n=1 Tax=Herbaspirillum sp. LeCh32-8 TaxID=2821356 RepID=UPI001AE32C04|nr:branched-chain amino acid ABC transporter substrate-binding protein [Herbaspirillum sp. LeCh32-8]MBP0597565.1 branched-chain amino acid ABC transporter substrate-binding protein [Herbaspirillum sp. LeCh32-8]
MATPAFAQAPAKVILIGFAGPLSEEPAQSARDAALMAIQEINARSPQVAGEKVQFKLLDQNDKADANIAALTARYFVSSKVVGVIGHWNSATSIAAARIYSDAGIVQISPSATASQYTQLGLSTAFRMVGHDGNRSSYIGRYAVNVLRAQRILVIDDATSYGAGMADQFTTYVRTNSGLQVSRGSISSKTSNFVPVLDLVRKTHPDLIFHAGRLFADGLTHGEGFVGGLARLGYPGKLILGEATIDPHSMRAAEAAGIDVYAVSPGTPLEKLPGYKVFQKNFSKDSTARITPYTPAAYDAVYVLVDALQRAGSRDAQAVQAALRKGRYNGVTGTIAFDGKGDLVDPRYTIYKIRQGAWVPLEVTNSK